MWKLNYCAEEWVYNIW